MLEENTQLLWNGYIAQERQHVRSAVQTSLEHFIAAIAELPSADREAWVREIAKQVVDDKADIPVRMPLFRQVIFPVLCAGYQIGNSGCARWLAGFQQYIVQSPEFLKKLDNALAPALLRTALRQDPNDSHARRMLISFLESSLEFSIHEVPSGVLYGMNGASIDECDLLKEELDEFCSLISAEGCRDRYQDLVDECRLHFSAYQEYLKRRQQFTSYAAYLAEKHNIEL